MTHALKFIGPDTIEGLAIPFGGSFAGGTKDIHGERFDANVDLCLDWFPTRPLLYDHGLDEDVQAVKVGSSFIEHETRAEGIWVQSQLDRHGRYRKAIDALIEQEALGYSSGAYRHLVRAKSGIIDRWPVVELSLTPTPAEPSTVGVHFVKSADLFDLIDDVPLPVKAAIEALDGWASTHDSDGAPGTGSLEEKAGRVTAAATDLTSHVEAYAAMRAKSGRVLSTATRERLLRHPSLLRELADDLEGLLSTADADKSGEATKALAGLHVETERILSRMLGVDI